MEGQLKSSLSRGCARGRGLRESSDHELHVREEGEADVPEPHQGLPQVRRTRGGHLGGRAHAHSLNRENFLLNKALLLDNFFLTFRK